MAKNVAACTAANRPLPDRTLALAAANRPLDVRDGDENARPGEVRDGDRVRVADTGRATEPKLRLGELARPAEPMRPGDVASCSRTERRGDREDRVRVADTARVAELKLRLGELARPADDARVSCPPVPRDAASRFACRSSSSVFCKSICDASGKHTTNKSNSSE